MTSVTVKVGGTAAINNAAVRAHAWHGDMTCKALAGRTILPGSGGTIRSLHSWRDMEEIVVLMYVPAARRRAA